MKKIFFILSISLMMLVSSFPYNFISNQDNAVYAEGSTRNSSSLSTSAPNNLQNGSFEEGQTWTKSYNTQNQENIPSWNTTATDKKIEMFRENQGTYIYGVKLKPSAGFYAAELNAKEESTLY
ncbi:MAG: hypothetical protein PUD27_02355, partial [Solobacterium sp.]|nr:hypothetical protein [Solobacterium sp.]